MTPEPISPELVLVDADLGARARAALGPPPSPPLGGARASGGALAPAGTAPTSTGSEHQERHYPAWARVTAALWLLVIGILVGGAAIPHAQDRPRIVPKDEDTVVTVCKPAASESRAPGRLLPHGLLGGG